MTEPSVFVVHLGCGQSQRVSSEVLRAGGDSKDALDGFFLEYADSVFSDTQVHQHLVEFELVRSRCPESRSCRGMDMVAIVGSLFPIALKLVSGRRFFDALVHFDLRLELLGSRLEGGSGHSERLEDAFLKELLPRHLGYDFDDCGADIDSRI